MGKFKGMNSKAAAAKERDEAHKLEKEIQKKAKEEEKFAKEWQLGANLRAQKRAEMEEKKILEKEKKKTEMKKLLSQEENELGQIKSKGRTLKIPKNADLPPWEQALIKKHDEELMKKLEKPTQVKAVNDNKMVETSSVTEEKSNNPPVNAEETNKKKEALVNEEEEGKQDEKIIITREEKKESSNETEKKKQSLNNEKVSKKESKKTAKNNSNVNGSTKNVSNEVDDNCEYNDLPEIEPNWNRIEEVQEYEMVSGIDAALGLTSTREKEFERHPEKRQKAAYKTYEEKMLPTVREEFPGLRHSQYKERIFEMWKKAPENPMNQLHVAYNAKKKT